MVAFFGGSYEGAADVKIWAVVLKDGHAGNPVILAEGKVNDTITYPCWNPVLYRSHEGTLFLFYKVGKNPREWFGMMKSSRDEGHTWTEPSSLPPGILGPVKNRPLELADGKLLCPSSMETETEWKVQMEIYNAGANSWEIRQVDPGSSFQVIQPTILTGQDSVIRILCRSKSNVVITSYSMDQGKSWSSLSAMDLPNPNSGIDAVTLHDGSHLLAYNPLVSGKEWVNGRNRLNLAWSADGLHWSDIMVLENAESGEFSYPAIIQTPDNLVHLTYTNNRTQIKYVKLRIKPST